LFLFPFSHHLSFLKNFLRDFTNRCPFRGLQIVDSKFETRNPKRIILDGFAKSLKIPWTPVFTGVTTFGEFITLLSSFSSRNDRL